MFLKQYPEFEGDSFSVGLDDLLEWPYWADFIKLCSKLYTLNNCW